MGSSRQEYWTELSSPPPGDLPDPEIKPASLMSPALVGGFFTTSATWEVRNPSTAAAAAAAKSLSCVRLFVTPWIAAYQASLSMGFSRKEYWSGVPLPSPVLLQPVTDIFCIRNTQ